MGVPDPPQVSAGEVVRLLERELADTNAEVLALTVELDKRIEELRSAEKQLRKSLAEKTTLLQEVHHRVKNNLQIVCSLLSMQVARSSMQVARSDNDSFGLSLQVAHQRVLTMSLIHEQLYQSESFAHLDFGQYIRLLSDRLFSAYTLEGGNIHLELDLEPIDVSMDQAIPCGLILNELLSNALKHAFPDGRKGTVGVTFRNLKNGYTELVIADNGVGLPVGFQWEDSRGLGLTVVRALVGQLEAEFVAKHDNGTVLSVKWKKSG